MIEGKSQKPFWMGLTLLLLGIAVLVLSAGIPPAFPNSPVTVPTPTPASVPTRKPESLGILGQEAVVTEVIDGDTIEIEGGQKVRYIGIDTPETVDPRRPVGCFGKEASSENKKLVEGKTVILVRDISQTDKFGRFLRYVYLFQEDGSSVFVNDYLVRAGFAKASTYPPDVKFTNQFLQAQEEARQNRRGLWQACPF